MKKVLSAAFLLLLPSVAMAQTAGQSVIGYYANAPQPGCIAGPCFIPYGATIPTGGGTTPAPQQVGITPTDRTIVSTSGVSQQIMAANSSRHSLLIQNTGNANCGVNPTGGTAVIGGAGTLTLLPNSAYSPRIPTVSSVTVICTAGQPIYGNEN